MSYSVLSDGFIRHYLYTGRKESEFSCDVQETNQLRSEKKMRELAARHDPLTPPADLEEIAAGTGAFHYTTSNARIDGYKTGDYLLTSVQSPRRDGVQRVWQPEEREEMRDHFIYVKSLNEHFHGTTQFQPGEYGYQQHMWYAALSDDLVVFANHPGHTCEDMSEVRPGYWYGNGAMAPASAYLVVCGSTAESGSFDAFCQSCLDRPVAFDTHTATLHCAEFDLPFTAGSNGTQILD